MRWLLITALCALSIAAPALVGCGGKESAVTADTAPFERAIAQYLTAKSLGMQVAEFEALQVKGDTAEAVCRMREESGMHRLTVRWRFRFTRKAADRWEVTSREAL